MKLIDGCEGEKCIGQVFYGGAVACASKNTGHGGNEIERVSKQVVWLVDVEDV